MNLDLPAISSLTMTSREIAVLCEKEHIHVVRDIGDIFKQLNIAKEGYIQNWIHPQNSQTYQEFSLPKDLTLTLVSGYSVTMRKRIIDRWLELESKPAFHVPQSFAAALQLAADQAKQIEAQAAQLEAAKPAVEFLDRYVEAKSTKGFREVAKVLGIKESEFIGMLLADGVLFRQSGRLLPKADYQQRGLFECKTGEANGHAFVQTKFTPSGVAWAAKRYAIEPSE